MELGMWMMENVASDFRWNWSSASVMLLSFGGGSGQRLMHSSDRGAIFSILQCSRDNAETASSLPDQFYFFLFLEV